jgi:uncharacterized protein (DUF779 family)
MGDVCIGIIEDVEFWVDKDLFEYWKHTYIKSYDAFGAGFLETRIRKHFKLNIAFYSCRRMELEPVKYIE